MENQKKKQDADTERRLNWIWEFSKRVVVICTAAYFLALIYTMVVIAATGKTGALTTLLSENAGILKTCVFGYFVKAGMENALKIKKQRQDEEKRKDEEEDDV